MWDCINTFNTCTFENIYKIEDELYNVSENEYMKLFLILLNSKFETSRYISKAGMSA